MVVIESGGTYRHHERTLDPSSEILFALIEVEGTFDEVLAPVVRRFYFGSRSVRFGEHSVPHLFELFQNLGARKICIIGRHGSPRAARRLEAIGDRFLLPTIYT
ncbi:hypothetical protein AWC05_00785 [Mycobacterium florentinum]|uniref:Uncharacterized protein n=1 Tax=Mycobacterium florentinum TaxID=292462 RepID=A0A1X1TYM5_MYCFL|nr:hypothetical protein AWC05_00785 [Mycobacterium florentinum]